MKLAKTIILTEDIGIKTFERLINHVEKRTADKKWYLEILSVFAKYGMEQEILQPGYRWKKSSESDRPIMSKSELEFYRHLPEKTQLKVLVTATPHMTSKQKA